MPHIPFTTEWISRFQDPYAVMGLSVTADDRRVLKRYRDLAKLLHPDRYVSAEAAIREMATQLFSKMVGPAYQKLKQDKGRAENLAMLRFRVRRLTREQTFDPRSTIARELMGKPAAQIDVFYEQAIARLCDDQYRPLDRFEVVTSQLDELNLVYLRLKMGEPIIREKRTGIVSAKPPIVTQTAPVSSTQADAKPTVDYAQRHYERAQSYASNSKWAEVVRELKDALKLDASRSNYHALLAVAYLKQDLPTMGRVHCRQALKLNPNDKLAIRYAPKFGIDPDNVSNGSATGKGKASVKGTQSDTDKGLFSIFSRRR
ncbi:MAG: J domain-containing protein [Cyanobacteria bacterium J06638_20]